MYGGGACSSHLRARRGSVLAGNLWLAPGALELYSAEMMDSWEGSAETVDCELGCEERV